MPEHVWLTAVRQLHEHYGSVNSTAPRYSWRSMVESVCGSGERKGRARGGGAGNLQEFPDVRSVAHTTSAAIPVALREVGFPTRHAATLRAVALWWLRDQRREHELAEAWDKPLALLREELQQIPGVSLLLADRILLQVAGRAVFPVDRATLRVVVRHGWLDSSCDYDEWQRFCAQPLAADVDRLQETSALVARTGREFCGTIPDCEQCPLASLLPARGPLPLSDEDA